MGSNQGAVTAKTGFEDAPHGGLSPWAVAAQADIHSVVASPDLRLDLSGMSLEIGCGRQSAWIIARWPDGGGTAVRAGFCPAGMLNLDSTRESADGVELRLTSSVGAWRIRVNIPETGKAMVRCTASLTPDADLLIPFWPRDVYPLDANCEMEPSHGVVHAAQRKTAGGVLYFTLSEPACGSVLYVHNLTSLNPYFEATSTTPDTSVAGRWPELGYMPPCDREHPLPAGKEMVMSDAIVRFSPLTPKDGRESAGLFLDLLSDVYPLLDPPETRYHDWPGRAAKTLYDLATAPDCAVRENGCHYIHPYIGAEPPDSMAQMSVLFPLKEYERHIKKPILLAGALREGVPGFWDKKLGVMRRYLLTEKDKDNSVIDSWYLYHPVANLGRLVEFGDEEAKQIFLASMPYAMETAHHFNYQWPVNFHLETREVVTGARKPGEPGESDVGGAYAYVMLQAFEITEDRKYLAEAERAVEALKGLNFSIGYQFNNCAWGAAACLHLWRVTGKEIYRDQSYVFLGSFFQSTNLWQSRIGHAAHYPTFLGVTCLHDAQYMAAFEEFESVMAFTEYLQRAGNEVTPAVRLMVSEYIRHALDRLWYYYPSELPEEALATDVREGRIDRGLAIPLEDLYNDGSPAGAVGQEVYGSGAAFAVVARAYHDVPEAPFVFYCDYPVTNIAVTDNTLRFRTLGNGQTGCRLRFIPRDGDKLPSLSVRMEDKAMRGAHFECGEREYSVPGAAEVAVDWHGV